MTPHTPLSALDPHSPIRLFPDDEFRVVNAVDASKQLAFDLSAITTGTTRTVTIPDASGTMALLERAQTFTKLATFALGLTVAGAALSLDRTATLSSGASEGYFKAVNTANAQGVLYGVGAAGHAYVWNTNSAAGNSNTYYGNSHANNTGAIYIYQKGAARVIVSDVVFSFNGATASLLSSNGATGYGGFYANGAAGTSAYYFFAIAGVETARMASSVAGMSIYTGSAVAPQFEFVHAAGANHWVGATGSNGGNPRVYALSAGGADNLTLGTGAALATNATVGHICIPSCAGTPTGVPTGAGAGNIPLIYDTTNNKIYAYNGAWKATAALT